ncbi:hypothetical protein V7266_29260 [Neobacillus drentensis]|uniref:hypothetical protein n=1 Tax=Neobacillus drentensis TaxID=220684 RepID=UPI002FFDDD0F
MQNEKFDIEILKLIENKLDNIYSIAKSNYNDHPELMDTIENLAKVANIFAKSKIQELKGQDISSSPQGLIVSKIANSYDRMQNYEKQKNDINIPPWKL